MKKKILVTDVVSDLKIEKKILKNFDLQLLGIDKLKNKDFARIEGVITGHTINFDKKTLSKLVLCKTIVRYGAGYNNIDIEEAKKRNIRVFNVPDYGVNEVADHALAIIMNFLKNINSYYFNIIDKNKDYWNYKNGFIHRRLSCVKLGIVGLGRIGHNLAKKANSLGMQVFYYDPYLKKKISKDIKQIKSLKKMFQSCDAISLHAPSKKDTKFFINDEILRGIPKSIIFVNTARGDLIQNKVLLKYFLNNKLKCIGLDTLEQEPIKFNSKLYKLAINKKFADRIILTPHSAFYTEGSFIDLRTKAAKTLQNFFIKKKLKNCVNL